MSEAINQDKINSKKKKKRAAMMFFAVVCFIISIGMTVNYVRYVNLEPKVENLEYSEGEVDYFHTFWRHHYYHYYWRRKRFRRKRNYLDMYLKEDLIRYSNGEFFFTNIYEEPFYQLLDYYGDQNVKIGYVSTDDPFVKEIYSLEIEGIQVVDKEGVIENIKNAKLMMLIGSILSALAGFVFLLFFFKKRT